MRNSPNGRPMGDMSPMTNRRELRWANQLSIIKQILTLGPRSRTQIADKVGLTRGTVTRITRQLIDAGLLYEMKNNEHPPPSVRPGRRPVYLDVNAEDWWVLGITFSPSMQTVMLANIKNHVVAEAELYMDNFNDPDRVIAHISDSCARLIDAHIREHRILLGGVLLISGTVNTMSGRVKRSQYLGWRDVPLQDRLTAILDLPIKVMPMMSAFALAETLFGKAVGQVNVLTLICGLGLASSLVLDGRPVESADFPVGVIGPMPVLGEHGQVTRLDRVAGGYGIIARLCGEDEVAELSPRRCLMELVATTARDRGGNTAVAAVLADAGRALGRIAAQFTHFVGQESLVIAGPLTTSPSYVKGVREAFAETLGGNTVQVVVSDITGLPGSFPAACGMAIHEFLINNDMGLAALHSG